MKRTGLISIALFCFFIILIGSFSSFKGGLVGQTTQGCFCHQMPGDSASIRLLNAPVNGFVAGQTYNLSVEVENINFMNSAHRAGFNLHANKGSLQAGTGSRLTSGELTHTEPASLLAGKAVWNFSWQAPSSNDTGDVTFFVAGVVANGDTLANNLDVEGMDTFNVARANATNLSTYEKISVTLSPNPSHSFLNVELDQEIKKQTVSVRSLTGAHVPVELVQLSNSSFRLNTSKLADGMYFVQIQYEDKLVRSRFIVQNP